MFDIFKKYLSDKGLLPDDAWSMIEAASKIRHVRKRQFILQQGDVWEFDAFVCHGCLCRYTTDDKGKSHIIQFSPENWWAGDRESLVNGTPAKYSIEAIEDTYVLLIHKDDFEKIMTAYPEFTRIVTTILQRSATTFVERVMANMSNTAEQKYLDFMAKYPGLAGRVSRAMLASYLSITPEALSLIRKKASKR